MLHEETDNSWQKFIAKTARKLFHREQWFIEIEISPSTTCGLEFSGGIPLYPPPDRFWADPFVVSTSVAHYIFVEEAHYATGKGHIAVIDVSHAGVLRNVTTILERPYHLSYPFLFEWDRTWYMIPESSQNQAVELYRSVEFPHRWVLDRVLMAGVRAADATIVAHNGRWWMFLTQAKRGESIHEHLYLYHAETPIGPYLPHSGNPIKSGLRGTRPAGALFQRAGALHRPAQDCSRVYGEAVILHRVDELSTARYVEVEVGRIAPKWRPEVRRVHTVNGSTQITVVDALRWIPR